MYSTSVRVVASACDENRRLKLYGALQMMQDCSVMWLDDDPVLERIYREHGITQLLASRQIEVIRVPSFMERLTVETSVWEMNPVFGYRNTFIYDEDGKPCYKSWSQGVVADRNTGKLARMPQSALQAMTFDQKLFMSYADRRIDVPVDALVEKPGVTILRSDLDYNHHVNNANYIRIAMDLIPAEFIVTGLRVEYKMAARLGDVLLPHCLFLDTVCYVVFYLGSRISTIIEFTGKKA